MMDLLVQICSANKLKPQEHVISVVSDETGRAIEYQPSQSIGSLAVNRIFLISKASQRKEKDLEKQRHKDASKFEVCNHMILLLGRSVLELPSLPFEQLLLNLFKLL